MIPVSRPLYLLDLPSELLQRITTQVGSLGDLRNLGMTCRRLFEATLTPHSEYWRSWIQRHGIVRLPVETPKAAVQKFFGQFLDCIKETTKIFPEDEETFSNLRLLRKTLFLPTVASKYRAAFDFLQKNPELRLQAALKSIFLANQTLFELLSEGLESKKNLKMLYRAASETRNLSFFQVLFNKAKVHAEIALTAASRYGTITMVGFALQNRDFNEDHLRIARMNAAMRGNISILKRLFQTETAEIKNFFEIIDAISDEDRITVEELKPLIPSYLKGLVFIYACGEDYLDILDALRESSIFDKRELKAALFAAIEQNNLRIISYLFVRFSQSFDSDVIERAAKLALRNGDLGTYLKIEQYEEIPDHSSMIILACGLGNLTYLKLFGHYLPKDKFSNAINHAAYGGHLPILQALFELFPNLHPYSIPYQKGRIGIVCTAAKGNFKCLKELLVHHTIDEETREMAIEAARLGNFSEIIEFLKTHN